VCIGRYFVTCFATLEKLLSILLFHYLSARTCHVHTICVFFHDLLEAFSFSGVPLHDFYRNICGACAVTVVIFGRLSHSFYLLTYLSVTVEKQFSVSLLHYLSATAEIPPEILLFHYLSVSVEKLVSVSLFHCQVF